MEIPEATPAPKRRKQTPSKIEENPNLSSFEVNNSPYIISKYKHHDTRFEHICILADLINGNRY
jgi:hypothetical protein